MLNTTTGELVRQRVTTRRVRAALAEHAPGLQVAPAALDRLIAAEREARQQAAADAREYAKARQMKISTVRKKARSLAAQANTILHAEDAPGAAVRRVVYTVAGETYTTQMPPKATRKGGFRLLHLAGIYAAVEAERDAKDAENEALQRRLLLHWLDEQDTKKRQPTASRTGQAVKLAPIDPPAVRFNHAPSAALIARLQARQQAATIRDATSHRTS